MASCRSRLRVVLSGRARALGVAFVGAICRHINSQGVVSRSVVPARGTEALQEIFLVCPDGLTTVNCFTLRCY
jgi:hypothetical protein